MANDISSRQWRLDTPVVFGQANAIIWRGNVKVQHFEFSGYAAQGNQAIVKDQNGKVVWQATGAADLEEVRSGKIGWVNGVVLDTLTGGGIVVAYIE